MKVGKLSESALKRSVLRQIHTKREEIINGAGVGEDCAIFALSEADFMVSCMQEGELTEPQKIGGIITKCVNNLVVGGATPMAVMITLLLPESVEEPWIKQVMNRAEAVCHQMSVQIAGGQTRISQRISTSFAIVTGYGKVSKDNYHTAKAGQDIVISKWIGLEGTSLMAKQYRQQILERYPAYLVEEAMGFDRFLSIIPEAATAMKSGVGAMHDASEGGIFASLWELAEGAGVGLTIDLKKYP